MKVTTIARTVVLPLAVVMGVSAVPVMASAQGVAGGADVSVSASAQATLRGDGMVVRIAAKGEAEIIAALEAQGFAVVETGRTLLGRIRITAEGAAGTREVILHQRTGEVLRDVVFRRPEAEAAAAARAGLRAGARVGADVTGAVDGVLDGAVSGSAGVTGSVGGSVGGALDGLSGSAGGSVSGGLSGGLGL